MIRSIASLLLVVFATTANLHLPALQVAAWVGMLVNYSRDATLTEAVEMTFDGEHPCPMCKAIEAEQTKTDPDAIQGETTTRLILFIESPFAWRATSSPIATLRLTSTPGRPASHQPDTPPPRSTPA